MRSDYIPALRDMAGSAEHIRDVIKPRTYVILAMSSLILAIICLCTNLFIIELIDSDTVEHLDIAKLHGKNQVLYLTLGMVLIVVIISIRAKSQVAATWLYVLLFLIAAIIVCLVNLTGGITNSPFTSLYGALMTVVILIYDKVRAIIFSLIIIAVSMFINLHCQNMNWHNSIITNTATYRLWYVFILCFLVSMLSLIDFLSRSSQESSIVRRLFPRDDKTTS